MKKSIEYNNRYFKILSFLIIIVSIVGGYLITPIYSNLNLYIKNTIELDRKVFDFGIFSDIAIRNLIVSFILSIGGYLTAGMLSLLTLIWNGVVLGALFTIYHNLDLNIFEFASFFVFHGVFEFYAFILFASIGFKGIRFYKQLLDHNRINIELNIKEFKSPILLILFAALLESMLITNT